ncbi:hypothetical protein V1264_010790 [Littorina saxatilis]|uniref:Uncharacterized protein n=1 Tax=Littorina saxatilis TaxID=31220 RepID=A0AAN9AQB3_9CAEN
MLHTVAHHLSRLLQEAYKQWLCASTLTYYLQGQTLRPCKTFCQQVEAMCPFFRPKVDTHEGDPSFICKDPEIEGGVHPDGSHVTSACFHLCHVISGAEIKQTFCGTNQSRCEDLQGQLEGCPALPAPASLASRTDNSSGSINTTSAARASVYSEGRGWGWVRPLVSWGVTLTVTGASSDLSAVRLTTVWIVVVAGSTMMLSWLWLALTSYPYSCIGLT